jgi:rod shape determining protein RodA
MRREKGIFYNIDWVTVVIYLCLVFIGWISIYAAVYNEEHHSILDITQNYGRQMIWISTSIILALIILIIDPKFFNAFSLPIYIVTLLFLIAVLFFGKVVGGARSWFQFGPFAFQPSEFAKVATALALARFLGALDVNIKSARTKFFTLIIIGIPMILIYLQNDTGSALVYVSFILVMFREGLSGKFMITIVLIGLLFLLSLLFNKYIVIGLLVVTAVISLLLTKTNTKYILAIMGLLIVSSAFVFSVDYAFMNMLEPHQRSRINVLLGKEIDPHGAGYNVNQSKIAIGSGGFTGKGFLKGTQTKYDFVPEQSTDFIFCTIGEEWGFVGSFILIALYSLLMIRLIFLAERQRSVFSRVYGYGVASILFFHFAINIGMTIGLAPVIGIPLPFISYGGSSLWAFTALLFIFIKLDARRRDLI